MPIFPMWIDKFNAIPNENPNRLLFVVVVEINELVPEFRRKVKRTRIAK